MFLKPLFLHAFVQVLVDLIGLSVLNQSRCPHNSAIAKYSFIPDVFIYSREVRVPYEMH
jgi:hypothetical protein